MSFSIFFQKIYGRMLISLELPLSMIGHYFIYIEQFLFIANLQLLGGACKGQSSGSVNTLKIDTNMSWFKFDEDTFVESKAI